jgi:histidyl-tRNA synthetase
MQVPPTPKGFRDILPELAKKRRGAVNKIADTLEDLGFVPIETPTIEFAQTLTGKYGDEERLIYKFTDRGERDLALRYDLTVPLARFIADNQRLIGKEPFRRYQVGQVFRGENPQAGRYREFTQFDFDTIGSGDLVEDALIITSAIRAVKSLGLDNPRMIINNRTNFINIPPEVIRAYDKLSKIGQEGVNSEIKSKGFTDNDVEKFKTEINSVDKKTAVEPLFKLLGQTHNMEEGRDFVFDPTLARGLDYYTGSIYELKMDNNPASLSIGAGGRFDNLIGSFCGRQIPAVGFSFGLDRLIESLG